MGVPEARGHGGLLSFMRRGPLEDTQVLAGSLQNGQGGHCSSLSRISLQIVARNMGMTAVLCTLQDLFSGQQDSLCADVAAAAPDSLPLEGGLKLRLDSEVQPEPSLQLRLDSETHASENLGLRLGSGTQAGGALQPPGSNMQGDTPAADELPGSQEEGAQEEAAREMQDEDMGPATSEDAGTQSGDDADAEDAAAGAYVEPHMSFSEYQPHAVGGCSAQHWGYGQQCVLL